MLTPYQFANNVPIAAIDLDGLESVITVNSPFTSAAIKSYMDNGDEKSAWLVVLKTLESTHKNPDGSTNETDFVYTRSEASRANSITGSGQKEGDYPGTFNYCEGYPKGFTVYGVDDQGNQIILMHFVWVPDEQIEVDLPAAKYKTLLGKWISNKILGGASRDEVLHPRPGNIPKKLLHRGGTWYVYKGGNSMIGQDQGGYMTDATDVEKIDATAWFRFFGAGQTGDITTLIDLVTGESDGSTNRSDWVEAWDNKYVTPTKFLKDSADLNGEGINVSVRDNGIYWEDYVKYDKHGNPVDTIRNKPFKKNK